jgi:glutaredoxin-like protein NrdH
MPTINHIPGVNKGKLILYALSTCIWCKKTKKLLESLGVEYDYIDVDLLMDDERVDVVNDLKNWNPQSSFPTLVVNNQKCIIGFNEPQIRTELEK